MDKTTVQDALTHLSALGFVEGDTVYMNCLTPSMKIEFVYPDLPLTSIRKAEDLGRNIFFAPNKGGYENKDIVECQALFYEHDDLDKEVSANLWRSIGLSQPTIQVDTGNKSIHTYYVLSEPISPELFREAQTLLSTHLKSDKSLKNPARLMRLCGGVHPKTGETATFYSHSGITYTIDDLLPILQNYKPVAPKTKLSTQTPIDDIEEARQALKGITRFEFIDEEYHWHRIGMSCKYISESLFDDWVQWSMASPKSVGCNFRERWDSWKGQGIKRGTLFQYAKDSGWQSKNPKYQPNEQGNFDHLDESTSTRPTAFKLCVDAVSSALGNAIKYNTLADNYSLDGVEATVDEILSHVEYHHDINFPRFKERRVIDTVAKRNKYNPVIEYFKSCKLNLNVSHCNFASKYWGGTATEDKYIELFLRAAVVRQTQTDPVEFPFVLVLVGNSGCGKSATFKILFKEWIYNMSNFSATTQNNALSKKWLCFWDEMLPVLKPKNRDLVNEFIVKPYVTYDVMYVEKNRQKPVPFVIGGTTTDRQFLSDAYSQRRWMVCKIPNGTQVNLTQLSLDVDAIWASAYQSTLINPSLGSFNELIKQTTSENKQYVSESDYYVTVVEAANKYMEDYQCDYVWVTELIHRIWGDKVRPSEFSAEVKGILNLEGFVSGRCTKKPHRDKSVWFKRG